jgi:hypothetical protein
MRTTCETYCSKNQCQKHAKKEWIRQLPWLFVSIVQFGIIHIKAIIMFEQGQEN